MVFLLLVACQFCVAGPASACLWNQPYPALWRQAPLLSSATDEVVLQGTLIAHAVPGDWNGTDCDGGVYVFRVQKVLQGRFDDKEVAIRLHAPGAFLDDPDIGDERIIVGELLGRKAVGDRYGDNLRDLKRQGFKADQLLERFVHTKLGGPSTVMLIKPRPPIEQRLLFVFGPQGPAIWTMIGLCVVILTVVGLGIAWLRRSRRGRLREARQARE
jgi:hypothetical protein